MNYANKALDVVKKHPFAAGVAATAATALLGEGMTKLGVMDASPAYRFVPYYLSSLSCAELNKQRVKNEKGRDLTFRERITSYLYGAITPMVLWEGWEEVGATEPVYKMLYRAFGNRAQQDFEGKGSFIDLAATVGAVMLTELGKEGVQYVASKFRKK